MLEVKDIMTTNIITVNEDDDIKKIAEIFIDKKINAIPVIDSNGTLQGIVSETDLVYQDASLHIPTVFTIFDSIFYLESSKHFKEDLKKITATKVKDIMNKNITSVKEDDSIEKVATIITDKKFYSIPVVDENNHIKGIVSRYDIIKTMFADNNNKSNDIKNKE
jgi:CBS-domain-containing membrane protein